MTNLRQRLFNTPPSANAPVLLDKNGEKFWLVCDDDPRLVTFRISYRGEDIGHVYLEWCDLDLSLTDIVIHAQKHRNRRVGTAVLERIVDFARQKGATSLFGRLAEHDLAANPKLIKWYQQHGFLVELVDDEHWAGNIWLALAQTADS